MLCKVVNSPAVTPVTKNTRGLSNYFPWLIFEKVSLPVSIFSNRMVIYGLDKYLITMDDIAKRGGLPTSELFTVILCGPNFAVS